MKKKLRDFFRENKLYVYTFLACLLSICAVFVINEVSPFGEKSLLYSDFYHQYGPMMGELRDRVLEGRGLVYSFNMGIGLPFFRNFFNYLSSPFNIILFLFNKENLVMAFSIIIGLKAVTSGVSMVYYLSKKFKSNSYSLIALGVLYAFSSWFVAYFWNIMWLDGMIFLPLIVLGIERIVDERKCGLYTVSLFAMMFANYFIAFMICIFSVVYFLVYSILEFKADGKGKKDAFISYVKTCMRFIGASVLAAMIGAFFLLPMGKSMVSISATGDSVPSEQYYKFEVEDYLFSHFSGVDSTVFSSDPLNSPNVSCGVVALTLVFLFILNPRVDLKVKLGYIILLGFFIAAFFVPQLDFMLHAFHVPNDLPYRYSFIYSFILIVMAGYALINMEQQRVRDFVLVGVGLMAVLIYLKFDSWVGLQDGMTIQNMIVLVLVVAICLIGHFKKHYGTVFGLALMVLCCTDAILSTDQNWKLDIGVDSFYENYDERMAELEYIRSEDKEKFYRIDSLDYMTLNDGSWYGYNGVSTFSSMVYKNLAVLQANLGIPGNLINSFYYNETTPIYDLMFDVKYIIGTMNDSERYGDYQYFDTDTVSNFYYTVGPVFGVRKELKNWTTVDESPLKIQSDYIEKATGIEGVLKIIDDFEEEILGEENGRTVVKYSFKNPGDNMYFYSDNIDIDAFVIGDCLYYNDEDFGSYNLETEFLNFLYTSDYGSSDERYIINIDSSEEVVDIIVAYRDYYSRGFELYYIDHEKFLEAYDFLEKSKLIIDNFEEDDIKGRIKLKEDMLVYTSIPYDEGWHVYIDGEEVKNQKVGGALLSFDCSSGEHRIELQYRIPYLLHGSVVSLSSVIGLIAYKIYKKKTSKI